MRMAIAGAIDIEDRAHRVEGCAGEQPPQPSGVDPGQQRYGSDHHGPAHAHIERQGRCRRSDAQFARHAQQGDAPHRPQDGPVPGTLRRDQGEGCVAAGNEQVDGAVVRPPPPRLRWPLRAVEKGGCGIQCHAGQRKNQPPGDLAHIPAGQADDEHEGNAWNGQRKPQQVGAGVEAFAGAHSDGVAVSWRQ